ncbi:MAG TPA: DegV family protein [Acidimicrobiales bacterium]|nr:DegV family protein [Acidimicrobiales bacterium]
MIGLVTDSNAQLPPALARHHRVEVVPFTVTVDGVAYAEGEDLDADGFWARFQGRTPAVTTSQPSPGRFAAAYQAVAARGADEILSIHIGSAVSGTVNSARLAADSAPVPVRVVDTGTASFAVACCVWEAGEALARGASAEEAAAVAGAVASRVGNVFVVEALDLARAGGRLAEAEAAPAGPDADGIPVLSLRGGTMEVVGRAADLDGAAEAMADAVRAWGSGLRVGVGVADLGTEPLGQALEARLAEALEVRETVRYRVGPSVGAHTGPGTVGAVFYPTLRTGHA